MSIVIEVDSRPNLFYRYQPHRPSLEWDKEILLESKLWFSTPDQFNDPFEVRPHIHWDGGPIPNRTRIEQLAEKFFPDASPEERAQRIEEGLANLKRPNVEEEFGRAVKEMVNGYRKTSMCCFAASNANICMWSYYASGHSGYCLGFSFSTPWTYIDAQHGETFLTPDAVNYQDEYPSLNLSADQKEPGALQRMVQTILLTKSREWSAEEEWRCVRPWTPAGHQSFPAEALRSITIGANMPASRQAEILSILGQRNLPIEVFKAIPEERRFGLRLDRVTL